MGGRIVPRDGGIVGLGDDLAGRRIDDHRPDRRLAGVGGGLRLRQRDAHGGLIMVDHGYNPTDDSGGGQAGDSESGERVAKARARAGVASRREIERLIEAGRVALNGKVLTTPAVKVAPGDILTVDGKVVDEPEPTRVWRYHKPVGLLTSHNDPKG